MCIQTLFNKFLKRMRNCSIYSSKLLVLSFISTEIKKSGSVKCTILKRLKEANFGD